MKKQTQIIILSFAITMVVSGCAKKKASEIQPVVASHIQNQALQEQKATSTFSEIVATSSEEIKYFPNGDVNTSDWKFFDSYADCGMKLEFTMKYPKTWGNIDSGFGERIGWISFYDRNRFSENCKKEKGGGTFCYKNGKVMDIIVENGGVIKNDDYTENIIMVDGYQSYIGEESASKRYSNDSNYLYKTDPFISNKVLTLLIKVGDKSYVKIYLSKEDDSSMALFNSLIRTIKFKK